MTYAEAAQRYWTISLKLRRGLRTEAQRQNFLTFTVIPNLQRSTDPRLTNLLHRLVREEAAA